jgi:hypothetical protein
MTNREKQEIRQLASELHNASGFFAGFFKAIKRELWVGHTTALLWVEDDAFLDWCDGWSDFPLDPHYLRKTLLAEWLQAPWKEEG